ncbi:hypothetical protein [Leadbettera azotonutricia]|uniref:PIN domain-containing protein n=1 Tax=Leadbettera azotonutricia (strain ATCC BAA-888 / DSM 13862 / ZAS-9) TaxID=545695 RepID=F5YAS2_LEAAZ|nr:hypothetical protein [Leadbettera azotonutricia]AEF81253.1 conserved hypothetical protein [Leadbettera azotonutricia ZAS-9]
METAKIYLETTMFSFYYAPDMPGYSELKAQVRQIFDQIKAGKYEAYTSIYAVQEIEAETNSEKRDTMKRLVIDYGVIVLPENEDAKRLAGLYIAEKAVPAAYTTDAAHIAITAANGLDFIVSLNFEHIARPWTVEKVRKVNIREGFDGIGIYRPVEVLDL